jgi:D-alanyl-D-alanine carboxypeptidase/D-alanyl-D-alanine-endopeptidase (penicillin-binding protein 4)
MRVGFIARVAALIAVAAVSSPAQETAPTLTTGFSSQIETPQQLAERLDRVLEDPALVRAHVGLIVQVAETGEVLYETAGEKLFTPASNTKVVTAAVALDALGADYRWTTRLVADGSVRNGTLEGDLWVVGGGDPWLTREEVNRWPVVLADAGIRRIAGDVIGDDRVFEAPQWGRGWFWHEVFTYWGAGVSGLQLRPNTIRARLVAAPGIGDPARLELLVAGPPLHLVADVRTGDPGSQIRLRYEPPPEGGAVRLRGWIPAGDSVPLHFATHHPTLYLLEYLESRLAREGVEVAGRLRRAEEGEAAGRPGWTHVVVSDSLGAAVAEMLKPSDNQMAESILRTVGMEARGEGSAEAGLEVGRGVLAGWGIEVGAIRQADGSGLSRFNRIAPNAMARLLRAMWRHDLHDVFVGGMPVAAVDGTMRRRLSGTPAEENVKAKTGSLAMARALSGYLTDGSGETLVFSLMLNDYDVPGDVAIALEDLLIEQVSLYRRPVQPGWPAFREDSP